MHLFKWLRSLMQWLKRLFPRAPRQQETQSPNKSVPTLQRITFYTVYIPTLDGRFEYLGVEAYAPGDIVTIPFGREDRAIFGIIEKSQHYAYGETPLPMWKMKYILGYAPEQIAEEYRRLKRD